MLADGDVIALSSALSRRQLDQRPRHGGYDQAEIACRKRIVAGSFEAKVEACIDQHRTGCSKILFKARNEITERALSSGEERARMPPLRDPCSMRRIERKGVAL
jgi:hypothetical protein